MTGQLVRSRWSRVTLVIAGLLGIGWGGLEGISRSDWLANRLRATMLRELEAVTDASVSIDTLRLGDSRFSFEIEGLEIRATNADSAPAFVTADSVSIRLGWRSFLGRRIEVEAVHLHKLHVQVRTGEEGVSNVPALKSIQGSPNIDVKQLDLTDGSIDWNGEPLELDFSGSGLRIMSAIDPVTGLHAVDASLQQAMLGPAGPAAVCVTAVAGPEGIEVRSAELLGNAFSVQVSGRLRSLDSPRFDGKYSAALQLPALAIQAATSPAALEGAVTSDGSLQWDASSGQLEYEGTASASDFGMPGLEARGDLMSHLRGDLNRLELTGITGALLGGGLEGSLELRDLRHKPSISAAGTLTGVSLESIAGATGSGSMPWSGLVDFRLDAEGVPWSDLVADVGIVVRASGGPSSLPVQGSASVLYRSRDNTFAISGLQCETPNAELRASGSIDAARAGVFQAEAAVHSGSAVEELLAAVRPQAPLPFAIPDGRYSFEGEVRGRAGDDPGAVLDGQFSVEDLDLGGQRWERLSLRGTLSPAAIEIAEAQLTDGDGRMRVRGTLPLEEGRSVQLSASGEGIDAAKLVRASGFGIPVDGAVSLNIDVSGSIGDPSVRSRIQVESPSFFGELFDSLEADVLYRLGGFELAEAALQRGDSTLRVTGSVDRGTQMAEISLASNPWPLAEFSWGRALMPGLTGTVEFELDASGQLGDARLLRELEMDGHWVVAGLRRNDQPLGHWTGGIRSQRDRQNIDLDWSANVLGGVIRGDADVWQVEPASYSGDIEFRSISMSQVAEFLGLPTERIGGEVVGSASFGGVIGVADTFKIDGTVDSLDLQVGNRSQIAYSISNVFPMRWGISEGALHLDSMALNSPDTHLAIDGSIGLGGDREIDMRLDGTLDLAPLGVVVPGLDAAGVSRVAVKAGGTLDHPALDGTIELDGATLSSPDVPVRLSEMSGSVRFENGQARVVGVQAASGGGTVDLSGVMAFRDSSVEYRLQAAARDMRVEYPENVSSVIDGQFTLAGIGSRSILNGDVTISRMSLREGLSFSDLFGSLDRGEGDGAGSSMFENMQVQVQIGAVSQLPVATDLMRDVKADLDLQVMGTVASPSLLGAIGISQGELHMIGTRYQIARGDVRFENPLRPEPVLNIELETRIRDTDLALVLSGPATSLALSYRSDPPITFPDLINLIVVGKEPTADPSIASQARIQQQSLVQTGADAILSQALSRPLSKRLQRFFGVSRLKVDPQIGGLEANPSARISTEQQIADDLTLIYSYDLSSAQQQSLRIEWSPDRRWSFIVTRDQNGLVGSDVLYKVRLP